MKICYVIDTLQHGGAENLLLDLIKHSSFESVVCYRRGKGTYAKAFGNAGAKVIDLEFGWQYDPMGIRRLTLRSQHSDLLHAHLPASIVIGRIAGTKAGIPVVSTHHNVPDTYGLVSRSLERWTRKLDTATVAVSNGVANAHGGRTWPVVHNGIDVYGHAKRVDSADPRTIADRWDIEGEPVFLTVGRYVAQKAQKDLIAAIPHLLESVPSAHFLLVGWGPQEEALQQAARDRGVADHVTITGRVESVDPYYAFADAFVLPSRFEGFGIVLLEAMASRLPVVATDIPGVQEVVADGETGLLVPPGRPELLAPTLARFADPELRERFGKNGFNRAIEHFDVSQTVKAYRRVYERVIREIGK